MVIALTSRGRIFSSLRTTSSGSAPPRSFNTPTLYTPPGSGHISEKVRRLVRTFPSAAKVAPILTSPFTVARLPAISVRAEPSAANLPATSPYCERERLSNKTAPSRFKNS